MSMLREFRLGEEVMGVSVLYFRGQTGWYIQIPRFEPNHYGEARFPSINDARLWAASVLYARFVQRSQQEDFIDLADGLSDNAPTHPVTGNRPIDPTHGGEG